MFSNVGLPSVRRLRQYSKESMAAAIDAVRSGRMRKSQAATFYGVPRTTLLDKLSGRTPEEYHSPLNRRIYNYTRVRDDKDKGVMEHDDTAAQVQTNIQKILESCAQEINNEKENSIKDQIKREVMSDSDEKHS